MTLAELKALKEKRAALIGQARSVLDKANTEKRSCTAEENIQYDKIMADVDLHGETIQREERLAQFESELTSPNGPSVSGGIILPNSPEARNMEQGKNQDPFASEEYRDAFMSFVRRKNPSEAELRTLIVGSAPKGGQFVPTTLRTEIMAILENENVMRRLCNVESSKTDIEYPVEEDYGTAYWTGEEEEATPSDFGS